MRLRPEIAEAISEGVKAGVFRRAARLNPHSAALWSDCAEPHTETAKQLLLRATRGASARLALPRSNSKR